MESSVQTIDEFCIEHRICRATFYNLKKQGSAPAIMRVGSRVLVSKEAAAAWRRDMETKTAQQAAA